LVGATDPFQGMAVDNLYADNGKAEGRTDTLLKTVGASEYKNMATVWRTSITAIPCSFSVLAITLFIYYTYILDFILMS